jgi:hypothetical protein
VPAFDGRWRVARQARMQITLTYLLVFCITTCAATSCKDAAQVCNSNRTNHQSPQQPLVQHKNNHALIFSGIEHTLESLSLHGLTLETEARNALPSDGRTIAPWHAHRGSLQERERPPIYTDTDRIAIREVRLAEYILPEIIHRREYRKQHLA